jgi:hypothetical protein
MASIRDEASCLFFLSAAISCDAAFFCAFSVSTSAIERRRSESSSR